MATPTGLDRSLAVTAKLRAVMQGTMAELQQRLATLDIVDEALRQEFKAKEAQAEEQARPRAVG